MRTCAEPSCGRLHHARGLCDMHYKRSRSPRPYVPPTSSCGAPDFCLFREPGSGTSGCTWDYCWAEWRRNVLPLIELGSRAALALGLLS